MKQISPLISKGLLLVIAGTMGISSTSKAANSCVSSPSGLVGWWRAENNASDSKGTNNGVLLNGTSFNVGAVGQAFRFNGSNQVVQIPYAPELVSSNFSVEAWVNPSILPVNDELIFGQNNGHFQLVVRTGTTGLRAIWQFSSGFGSFFAVSSSNQIPVGQFSHLVGTWDGRTLKIFVNGTIQGQFVIAAPAPDPGCPFFIGGLHNPGTGSCAATGRYFNGMIDEVSLFNRTLTSGEVAALYSAGSAGKCDSPPPMIASNPEDQRVTIGSNAVFQVVALSSLTMSYQWRLNGSPISGANSATLICSNVQTSDAGLYSVVVSNQVGSVVSSNALLTINYPPVANAQTVTLDESTSADITLSGTDPDSDPLTYSVVNPPTHGTLSNGGTTAKVTYQPNKGYHGPDSFTFTACDALVISAPGMVSINVQLVNSPPVAQSQSLTVDENTPLAITLSASDPDGDSLNYTVSSPAHGTLSGQAPNLTYSPNSNYFGPDSFAFTVNDGQVESTPATINITVSKVNNPPVAVMWVGPLTEFCGVTNLVVIAADDQEATLVLDGSLSSDPDGDALTYSWWDGTNLLATSVSTTNTFEVGTHVLTLSVSDGTLSGTDTKVVEVVDRSQSIALIIEMIDQSNLRPQTRRPLLASLVNAGASYERGNAIAGANQLKAFKNKVRAQVHGNELSQCLIDAADAIIDAGSRQAKPPCANHDDHGQGANNSSNNQDQHGHGANGRNS